LKNNLPYFSHDNDAGSHWKHKALRVRYGWEGYGRFWRLNELISRAENCKLRVENRQIRADSAAELGLSVQEFNEFLEFLADPNQCGLIQLIEEGSVITERTQENFAVMMKARISEQKRYRARKRNSGVENANSGTRNNDSDTRVDTKQSKVKFIDDDGDFQNSSLPRNRNSGTRNSEADSPSFTTADLRAVLAKSAPRDLTISDQLLKDLTTRLAAAGLGLGYVTWYGDHVRRQPNLANPGGYFRAHFGELVDRYRVVREKQAPPEMLQEEGPAKPEDIEKAFSGLPWRRPNGEQKDRDGPEELPAF